MKNVLLTTIIILLVWTNSLATHNRAGEITYQHVSGYTYKITLITYTFTPSPANSERDYLTMIWGDDTSSDIHRDSIIYLPDDIQKNVYIGNHTFPGPGVYQMVMSDPNRNADIINIPNSVNIVFTIKTTIKIDPEIGINNTPVLLNPPVDKAALGQRFVHNPSAFDIDGDSLSYKLTYCLGSGGYPIDGFSFPETSDTLYVDPITGDFVWDTPVQIGEYNVAMEIEEWRDGIKIGSIIRDMQIEVEETDNLPPVIVALPDYCVEAGNTLTFDVTASDPNNNNVTLTATGGPFEIENNPAIFSSPFSSNPVTGTFTWNTICEHIRKAKYTVLFRAEDDHADVHLTDYEESNIKVVAPAPQNLNGTPTANTIYLTWDTYSCSNAAGFKIYRRHGSYPFTPAECETGIPEYTEYELIATIEGSDAISYLDNGTGNGIPQGYTYCYRIIAYFDDDAESYTSNEFCAELIRGTPVFLETSVFYTDVNEGSIHLAWMQPTDFDNITYPGPYKYVLESSPDLYGMNFGNPVDINGITDTTYIDTLINTVENGFSYKLTLYSMHQNPAIKVGESAYTSSAFLSANTGDRKLEIITNENTPWTNYQYIVYRKNADEECNTNTLLYDSIGYSNTNSYIDTGLDNSKFYWYKVTTIGEYDLDFIPDSLVNFSQEFCVSPEDTIPPCKISFQVNSECDAAQNIFTWHIEDSCKYDIKNLLVFYSPNIDGDFTLIDSISDINAERYVHSPEISLAACYVITAQDSSGNYIPPENITKICIDECIYYELPNVFTPNGDNINDLFIPITNKFVEKIDLKIYNRWGNLVFETTDPQINWDGTNQETKLKVTDGIYYYICDVYEKRLSGTELRNINGFVQIIGNRKNSSE